MFALLMGFFWACFFAYNTGRKQSGLRWHEIKGVTKHILLGPGPTPKCRACGVDVPNPMLREPLGHGAFVCMDCEDMVLEEAGLRLPEWFERGVSPKELEEEKAKERSYEEIIEAHFHGVCLYYCLVCKENHERGEECPLVSEVGRKIDNLTAVAPGDNREWFSPENPNTPPMLRAWTEVD